MARDGSGNYSRVEGPYVNGNVADADEINNELDDIGSALSDSINRSGTKAFAGDQSMGGHKLTDLPAPASANDAARKVYVDDSISALSTVYQAKSAKLTAIDALTWADDRMLDLTGTGTIAVVDYATVLSNIGAQSVASLLTGILAVDGAGSGIDADKLDGAEGSAYAAVAGATFTGDLKRPTNLTTHVAESVGYIGTVISAMSGDRTVANVDAGQTLYHTSASTHTLTIDSNANLALPIGFMFRVVNENGAGALSVQITSDTLRWGSSTGTRGLAANGSAVFTKMASTVWRMEGTGIS